MGRAHAHAMLAGMVLAFCPGAYPLDPALDVSQYAHTAWKVREGFARGEINSIAQTPDGYLWLGTEFGLLRFDGARAVPWHPPANRQLPSSVIYSLLAARDGTLWIGTDKGLASWKNGQLSAVAELTNHHISTLFEDRRGSLWVGTFGIPQGKLCEIRQDGIQCYGQDGSFGDGIYVLYEDGRDTLWVGQRNGLWRWGPGSPKFFSLAESEGIRSLGEDDDGALLIGMGGGLKRFVNGKIGAYPPVRTWSHFKAQITLFRDHGGGLWTGTADRGLVHIHQGRTDVYTHADGLSDDYVNSLFEDREGNVWVGTRGGLDRFRDSAIATFSVKQGLSNNLATSVLASKDGSIWIGSAVGGLDRLIKGRITTYGEHIRNPRSTNVKGTGDTRPGKFNREPPNSLFQDSTGRIWVSTQNAVSYLDNDRFVAISGIPGGRVPSMAEDIDKNVWITNQDFGLFRLFERKVIQHIPWISFGRKDPAMALAADPLRGGVWLGFLKGGVAYFKDGQVRTSYGKAEGLPDGQITGFRFDQDGTLWVTGEGGLGRLKNGHFTTLTSKNGLPCDLAHGAMEDDDHSLWLYMPCGLVRIARSELDAWSATVDKDRSARPRIRTTIFDISDGMRGSASMFFYSPSVARSSDGRLWFLPTDGVSVVDPRHLPFNKLLPPVHIEQIIADRKTYAVDAALKLPALTRDLEIDYTGLSFVAPEKVQFRYKLEGHDPDWKDAFNERKAFYNDLPPRHYRFRVVACNNSGMWNEAGDTLEFSIAPAYYQTFWFQASCAAAFLALFWALYRYRLRQIARECTVRLEERAGERIRIARDLHDTLLQSFQGSMFRMQATRNLLDLRPEEAAEALDAAISRAEQAITEGRNAIQDLRVDAANSSDIAASLTAIGQELAHSQQSNREPPMFRVTVEGERQELVPILQDEIYRIALELLRNAFQHAQAHRIEAEIHYDDRLFRLRIRDDGKGIDPKVLKEGKRSGHWGLPGIRERAKQIGARLDFWSDSGSGTEVELTVPSSAAYAKRGNTGGFTLFRKKMSTHGD